MTIPVYNTGTVSVAANGTVVSNGGTGIWSNNVREGDWIVIDGQAMTMVLGVTDDTQLIIPTWKFGAKTSVSYAIYQNYSARDDSTAIAKDVGRLVAAHNKEGFVWFVGPNEIVPDPSNGDEGQFASQPSTGKQWHKGGGVWVYDGIFKGFGVPASYDNGKTYQLNDVATSGGTSYVFINAAPSAGHAPPNAAYWQVLAAKGETGATGPTGPGYGGTSTASIAIGTGSKVFTTQVGFAYLSGARIRASSTANTSNWMEGIATYSGATLTINVDRTSGTGTFNSWNFNVSGQPGAGDVSSINAGSEYSSSKSAFQVNLGLREVLTATRTYYVRPDGSNSNNGLSSATPFQTLQYTYDFLARRVDFNGFAVTIQLLDSGTKFSRLIATIPCVGQNGPSGLVIRGNGSTQSSTTVLGSSNHAIAAASGGTAAQVMFSIVDLKMETSGSGSCLFAEGGGSCIVYGNVDFGNCAANHIVSSHNAFVIQSGNYKVSGGAVAHLAVGTNAILAPHGATITFSNNPNFSGAFAGVDSGGKLFAEGMTFINGGTVTGQKFLITDAAIFPGSGSTVDFLPGSLPGRLLGSTSTYGTKNIPGSVNLVSVGGTYTVTPFDRTIWVDATAGNVNLNLYAISNYEGGNTVEIIRIDGTANVVTVVPIFGSLISNANSGANYVIGGHGGGRWRNFGANWFPVSWFDRAANVAEMKAASSLVSVVTPGRMRYHPGVAKGWVIADTSGGIQSSHNVTSVSDAGVGILGVNWAIGFTNGAYSPIAQGLASAGGSAATTYITHISVPFSATGLSAVCVNASSFIATDPSYWSVVAFGDQP